MRKPKTVWIAVLVVVVALGATAVGLRAMRVSARRAQGATTYSTAPATRGTLEVTVTGTGTLSPKAHQDCIVTAGGKVESVAVQPGQPVKAGDVLLVISNDSLSDQVAQARLQLRLAQMDLDAMTRGGGTTTSAGKAAAEAAVLNARLAAGRARENVDDLNVKAPFAGRVSGLAARAGDEVPAGATLLTVVSSDNLKAVLSVPEEDVKYLALGQVITVTVSPLIQDLDGRVTAIGTQGSPGAKGGVYYQVTVTLDDTDERARGGMTVAATIDTGDSWPNDKVAVAGTLAYDRVQPVVTATGGTVKTVNVGEGQTVAAGQVLLVLENDQAQAALASAEADLAQAEEKLAQITNPGPSSYPADQVEKARLRVEEAALTLAGLERQLDSLTVKAEIDGTVTEVAVSPGDQVPPNTRVAAVANLGQVEAVVTVDELQVARLAVGQTATVRIDALPGEVFSGTLESLSLEGTMRDGVTSYEARVVFPGDPRLRAGMSCSSTVLVARRENALLVPVEAVYGAGKEASVQILGADGQPTARPVVAGLSNNQYTEIVEGLAEGDVVVTGSLKVDTNPFGAPPSHGSQGSDTGEGGGQ